jgi:DNA-binding MarR family transcriptional regulator
MHPKNPNSSQTDDNFDKFDFAEVSSVNKVIHQPIRLQILSLLSVVKKVDMIYLKKNLGVTWGNLSSHITKLESAGYIQVDKQIIERKMYTTLQITPLGKDTFQTYRQTMKKFLQF